MAERVKRHLPFVASVLVGVSEADIADPSHQILEVLNSQRNGVILLVIRYYSTGHPDNRIQGHLYGAYSDDIRPGSK